MLVPTIPTPTTVAELQAILRQYPPASIFRIRLIPALAEQFLRRDPDRFRLVQPWETKKVANMIRSGEWDADVIPPWCLTADTLTMWTGGTRILAVLTASRDIDTRVQRIPDLPEMGGGIKPPSS
jgi:hypothetical protein